MNISPYLLVKWAKEIYDIVPIEYGLTLIEIF